MISPSTSGTSLSGNVSGNSAPVPKDISPSSVLIDMLPPSSSISMSAPVAASTPFSTPFSTALSRRSPGEQLASKNAPTAVAATMDTLSLIVIARKFSSRAHPSHHGWANITHIPLTYAAAAVLPVQSVGGFLAPSRPADHNCLMDPKDAHAHLIADAATRAAAYVTGAGDRPVFPAADAVAGLGACRTALPDAPRGASEVLAQLDEFGSPAALVSTHGRYFGFVTGGLDPAAHAAAILASAWDQNAGGMSPLTGVLDDVAGGWVIDALGLPDTAAA